jgi:LIVCS family branched-chain amino acid:cation transporter
MALFSMFFGAGNIIFPLIVGQSAGDKTPFVLLGLAISAVAFPFLGLVAMMFYSGNLRQFLERLGKWPALCLLFILQMAQGPIGAGPRLVTLMHASLASYFPSLSLAWFSVLICLLIFLLTYKPQRIVALLGAVLTPLLLASMALLFLVGMIGAPEAAAVDGGGATFFLQGLKGGYQTMDLIGALLFAAIIMPHLASPGDSKKTIRKRMLGSSLIAAALLMVCYVGLCWIASHHTAGMEAGISPEFLLQAVSFRIMGPWGAALAATSVFLACLTTAISLAAVFSDYVRKDLLKEKVSSNVSLGITLAVTAAMANLGFSGIMKLMAPVLEVLYPGLIVLCAINIANNLYQFKPIKAPVFFALGFAVGGMFT